MTQRNYDPLQYLCDPNGVTLHLLRISDRRVLVQTCNTTEMRKK